MKELLVLLGLSSFFLFKIKVLEEEVEMLNMDLANAVAGIADGTDSSFGAVGRQINHNTRDIALLTLDFYKHMEDYQHFSPTKNDFVYAEPYVNEKPDLETLEAELLADLPVSTQKSGL